VKLLLENVRCFCDSHTIELKPLTILVGENSTGKTTLLAMLDHVSKGNFPLSRPSFNDEPFDLGSFDSIATYKGGRYGRADTFSIGYSTEPQKDKTILATYNSYKGQPTLSKLITTFQDTQLSLTFNREKSRADIEFKSPTQNINTTADVTQLMESGIPPSLMAFAILSQSIQKSPPKESTELTAALNQWMPQYGEIERSFSLAPVRTKPRRTYDEVSDEFRPEGQHIPIQLARLWDEDNGSKKTEVADALSDFGKKSSLFKRIGVKRLGRGPTAPFQILVTTEGPSANLLDVGYGVSQALPVLVESLLATRGRRLLLQQPEVHLHPRGQAALGSFFAHMVSAEKKEFVIETHSDYILDRIRVEIAQGNLKPEELSILFFEKDGLETRIYPIKVDATGNISEAPSSYRRFFLDEEFRLIGRGAK
jgi:energy-coupling factor transporter ATP-binding protein EcfA2